MRFALDVVENIREKVGIEYPVGMRIDGDEYIEDGVTIDEAKQTAVELEKKGIDVIHLGAGNHHTMDKQIAPMYHPVGLNVHLAAAIKKAGYLY